MRLYLKIFFILITITGCFVNKNIYPKPILLYNSKNASSLLVFKKPDYGDGRADGCIVKGEMKLTLSSADKIIYTGKISDVNTNESIHNAAIQITFEQLADTLKTTTDSRGTFMFSSKSKIKTIQVNYIGYRPYFVKAKSRI